MANANRKQENTQAQGTDLQTTSARFLSLVERQFAAEMSSALAFTDFEKTLAQHMFLKVDMQLRALEAKRLDSKRDGTPIVWDNVNLQKLALDTVHRVGLGLDALIPNHIHPIPYFNKRGGKYDLDLRIGYVGKDLCRRKLAIEAPVEIIYQLVHETDEFTPHMRSRDNEIESYEFRITKPFDRGDVVGGFGYIVYDDARKNRLVLVTQRDFKRAESSAKTKDFWGPDKSREEMQFKTVVHRVTDKIPMDPAKVNAASYAYIEEHSSEAVIEAEVAEAANGEVIDITDQVTGGPEPDPVGDAAVVDEDAEAAALATVRAAVLRLEQTHKLDSAAAASVRQGLYSVGDDEMNVDQWQAILGDPTEYIKLVRAALVAQPAAAKAQQPTLDGVGQRPRF